MTHAPLRLALLGCGAISRYHRLALDGLDRVKITATIDREIGRAREGAAPYGARAFASLDEALAMGGFDAVDVMLPHHLHRSAALAVLEAGKHLLLEKPLDVDIAGCEQIIEAAKTAGVVFAVGENAQYWAEARLIARLLDENRIGELITVQGTTFFNPFEDFFGEGGWRFTEASAGGGIVLDGGLHDLRCLRMWLGEMAEVTAVTGRPFSKMEGSSLVRALMRSERGVPVSLDLLLSDGPLAARDRFRITGTKGEIVMDSAGIHLFTHTAGGGERILKTDPASYMVNSFRAEFEAFADAVLDGAALAATPESGLADVKLAIAIERAAIEHRWVLLSEM